MGAVKFRLVNANRSKNKQNLKIPLGLVGRMEKTMENISISERLNNLADAHCFTAYRKGDIKRFTKFLENKGWEIEEIDHHQNYLGWGVAVTFYSGTTPEGDEFYDEEVNWG